MKRTTLLVGVLMLLIPAAAQAAPKTSSTGAPCDSTGTARRTGQDDQGNKMNCLWDTCTYSQCSTSGSTVGQCIRKTEYSNPTDCHAAASVVSGGLSTVRPVIGGNKLYPVHPARPRLPIVVGRGLANGARQSFAPIQ